MSRIGKAPIPVPSGVTITLDASTNSLKVKGPKGELERTLPADIIVKQEGGEILVTRPSDEDRHKALHGLTRTLIANMVEGVTTGFKKTLEIQGVGYKAEPQSYGMKLTLGLSHVIEYKAPPGIKLTAAQPTVLVVEGASKELVGQVAAEIRSYRPPEPYKGKGVRYQGEQIRRKAGKAGKAGGK
ncbi:MAG: 50S ribosomal protein L6 [Chloroflexi bacterium]|nr:50S ribosomal protein L6 [Chloroflexota bacterium]MBA3888956.1 50S ribosomal protein L6 [Gemmatimonadaceae bacterium]